MFVQLISCRRAMLIGGAGALGLLAACSDTTGPTRRAPSEPKLSSPPVAPSPAMLVTCCNNIVFRRDTIGDIRIATVNADGTGLVKFGVSGSDPSWSPDHSKIVFTTGRGIIIMNADGSGLRGLTDVQGDRQPSFTPDGQKVVFVQDAAKQSDIVTVNLDGSNRQVLLRTPTAAETSPRYSPDGKKLAYMRTRKNATELVVWDLATNVHTVVASPANRFGSESWSPDSKRLAFSAGFFDATCGIAIIDANGANRKNFPSGLPGCFHPTWSPDGTELAFATRSNGLFRGKVDVASPPTRITLAPNVTDQTPVWQ
jgi:Tol biopolymer transport system component